jgi:hypothetical protein
MRPIHEVLLGDKTNATQASSIKVVLDGGHSAW